MSFGGKLASQSTVIFGVRLFGAGLIFLAQAAIARLWGPELLGEYLLVMATINIIGIIMPLGFETVGTYFAAEYQAKGEGLLLRSFMKRAYLHIAAATLLLLVAGYPIAGLLGEPGKVFATHWLPSVIIACATATVFLSGALLVGLKRPFAGFFADTLFRPMVIIAAFLISLRAMNPSAAFSEMMWLIALGYAAVSVVHFAIVQVAVRRLPAGGAPGPQEARRWWRFALPWVLVSLATDFFFDLDLLLLSGMVTREELAIFGVCTRIFALIAFGVTAVYAVTMPAMFEREALSDRSGFHRKLGDANLVASILAVVLFCGVAVGAPLAMMLFGPAFAAGVLPLSVLSLALAVRSLFGPAGLVLSIHDRPYAMLPAIAAGIVTLVLANLLLVPRLGLTGAALAALMAQTLWSGALWYTALKTARIDVSILPRLRELLEKWRDPAMSAAPPERVLRDAQKDLLGKP